MSLTLCRQLYLRADSLVLHIDMDSKKTFLVTPLQGNAFIMLVSRQVAIQLSFKVLFAIIIVGVCHILNVTCIYRNYVPKNAFHVQGLFRALTFHKRHRITPICSLVSGTYLFPTLNSMLWRSSK